MWKVIETGDRKANVSVRQGREQNISSDAYLGTNMSQGGSSPGISSLNVNGG